MPVICLFINWRNLVVPLLFSLRYHNFQAAHTGWSSQVTSFRAHKFTFGHLSMLIRSYLFPDGVLYFSCVLLMTVPKSECMFWVLTRLPIGEIQICASAFWHKDLLPSSPRKFVASGTSHQAALEIIFLKARLPAGIYCIFFFLQVMLFYRPDGCSYIVLLSLLFSISLTVVP